MNQKNSKMKYQEQKQQYKNKQSAFTNVEDKKIDFEMPDFKLNEDEELDRKLRVPRSEIYMQLFDLVDLISATDEEIIEKIRENLDEDVARDFLEMPDEEIKEEIKRLFVEEFESIQVEAETVLQGVLARCAISGCDCHSIDSQGKIIEHYLSDIPVPNKYQKGRDLLKKYGNACICVEVYNNCCRVIMTDSSVVTIKDNE